MHRPSYLDYIAVKRVNEAGQIDGEHRFLGLFTHAAYHESITRIPVLRRKLASVLAAAGLAPDSHDGQDLTEILEGYPREELFQVSSVSKTPESHVESPAIITVYTRADLDRLVPSCPARTSVAMR